MERDPPEMETSDSTKFVEGSERVKERVDVSPAFREATSELMEIVGLRVSIVRVRELSGSAPS